MFINIASNRLVGYRLRWFPAVGHEAVEDGSHTGTSDKVAEPDCFDYLKSVHSPSYTLTQTYVDN